MPQRLERPHSLALIPCKYFISPGGPLCAPTPTTVPRAPLLQQGMWAGFSLPNTTLVHPTAAQCCPRSPLTPLNAPHSDRAMCPSPSTRDVGHVIYVCGRPRPCHCSLTGPCSLLTSPSLAFDTPRHDLPIPCAPSLPKGM
ncbi:unnamed protein product [Cyclocybe aegerita]|uniref:Uncharacterized protein n=1 Tax=Cyclocybe aegerita TaxID=1973307 RepID=A0A8S0WKI5_CYCAE|nr:unnamed protein product [Cyclocybe aegerita]